MDHLNAANGEPAELNGRSAGGVQPHRLVLVLGMPGMISPSLVHALEREFPWARVEQRQEVAAACAAFKHPVSLILIDAPLLQAAEALAPDIMRHHPHALVALVDRNAREIACSLAEISMSRLIRGVLPMRLSLDIWLAVVRLMLSGGEYFPAEMFRRAGSPERGAAPAAIGNGPPARGHRAGNYHLGGLTAREVQILEMVSRGLQNKSIAAAFSLSESTVKIHLHNIIAKLGVHNRTEAAARFRDGATWDAPAS